MKKNLTEKQRNFAVSGPMEYRLLPPTGYYGVAFSKSAEERKKLKLLKKENKAMIIADFPNLTPSKRSRVLNPIKYNLENK